MDYLAQNPSQSGLFPGTSTRTLFPHLELGYFSALLLSPSIAQIEARKTQQGQT